jgi:hypothetical protein
MVECFDPYLNDWIVQATRIKHFVNGSYAGRWCISTNDILSASIAVPTIYSVFFLLRLYGGQALGLGLPTVQARRHISFPFGLFKNTLLGLV